MKNTNTLTKTCQLLAGVALVVVTGCGHTQREMRSAREAAFRLGYAEGIASGARENYHEELRALELPGEERSPREVGGEASLFAEPELPRHYYEVPVPGYTAADGVKIEPHTQLIQVVQP